MKILFYSSVLLFLAVIGLFAISGVDMTILMIVLWFAAYFWVSWKFRSSCKKLQGDCHESHR